MSVEMQSGATATHFSDDSRLVAYRSRGEAICRELMGVAQQIGFASEQLPEIEWQRLEFTSARDPADGSDCLLGVWCDARGGRIGEMTFNGDGSFYAEYDLLLYLPSDPRWFVEALTAWGRDDVIHSEPRLLAAPE